MPHCYKLHTNVSYGIEPCVGKCGDQEDASSRINTEGRRLQILFPGYADVDDNEFVCENIARFKDILVLYAGYCQVWQPRNICLSAHLHRPVVGGQKDTKAQI